MKRLSLSHKKDLKKISLQPLQIFAFMEALQEEEKLSDCY